MTMFGSNDVGHPDTPERQQAARVLSTANTQYQAIRARNDLSDLGKQANIAAVHIATKSKLADLQQSEKDRRAADRQDAEAKLFGLPRQRLTGADSISSRDAADRAAAIATPAEADALLDRATRQRDHQLTGAVAQHALAHGWRDVVTKYVGNDAAKQAALDTIRQHDATVDTPQDKMTAQMIFNSGKPRELIGVSQAKLQALADQAGRTE